MKAQYWLSYWLFNTFSSCKPRLWSDDKHIWHFWVLQTLYYHAIIRDPIDHTNCKLYSYDEILIIFIIVWVIINVSFKSWFPILMLVNRSFRSILTNLRITIYCFLLFNIEQNLPTCEIWTLRMLYTWYKLNLFILISALKFFHFIRKSVYFSFKLCITAKYKQMWYILEKKIH